MTVSVCVAGGVTELVAVVLALSEFAAEHEANRSAKTRRNNSVNVFLFTGMFFSDG